jgi:ABC-type antimicrobial peptide transport system permease subunit
MAAGRAILLSLVGSLLGAVLGGGAGLLGGLAYTNLAETSGFEGYSGYVVVLWMLAGIILGIIAGAVIGVKRARR